MPVLIEKTEGPRTEAQINKSFNNAKSRKYELIILGNSGTYRGINPDMINIPSYNFSHDNDSYDQIYYKLKWLEKNKIKIKYLVLGVDYFQFSFISDSRNYVYAQLLGEKYNDDFKEQSIIDLFLEKSQILKIERLKYVMNIFKKKQSTTFLKSNGQYIKPGRAKMTDKHFYSINRLPVQEKYFKEILNYCSKKNIMVFLVMLPIRQNALINYKENEINEFNKFIRLQTNDNIYYLDFSHQSSWNVEDYTDITHLNERAADRFSKQLNDSIANIIKTQRLLRFYSIK